MPRALQLCCEPRGRELVGGQRAALEKRRRPANQARWRLVGGDCGLSVRGTGVGPERP